MLVASRLPTPWWRDKDNLQGVGLVPVLSGGNKGTSVGCSFRVTSRRETSIANAGAHEN